MEVGRRVRRRQESGSEGRRRGQRRKGRGYLRARLRVPIGTQTANGGGDGSQNVPCQQGRDDAQPRRWLTCFSLVGPACFICCCCKRSGAAPATQRTAAPVRYPHSFPSDPLQAENRPAGQVIISAISDSHHTTSQERMEVDVTMLEGFALAEVCSSRALLRKRAPSHDSLSNNPTAAHTAGPRRLCTQLDAW